MPLRSRLPDGTSSWPFGTKRASAARRRHVLKPGLVCVASGGRYLTFSQPLLSSWPIQVYNRPNSASLLRVTGSIAEKGGRLP